MRTEDISAPLSLATSSPAEAVENIQGSQFYQISPDVFKENKVELLPDMKRSKLPPVATPTVAGKIAESPEHAAAFGPDAESLSWQERALNSYVQNRMGLYDLDVEQMIESDKKIIGNAVNRVRQKVGPERQLIDLGWKKLRSKGIGADPFTEQDDLMLTSLRVQAEQNFGYKDYGPMNVWESMPGEVAAQVADLGHLVMRNKGTIAAIAAAETAAGAGVGTVLLGPGPGTLTGAGIGLKAGLGTGYLAASFLDAYRSTAGSVYNELDTAVDEQGRPINLDDRNKEYLSHGVGIVSGGLSFVTDKLMMKSIPAIKKFFAPGKVKDLVTKPGNDMVREALIGIGKAMAINGTEESLQEMTQILGEEIGQTYDGTDVSFMNGLARAKEKLSTMEGAGRVAYSGAVGAVTAGALGAGVTAVDAGVTKVRINKEIAKAEKQATADRRQVLSDMYLRNDEVRVRPLQPGEAPIPKPRKSDLTDTRPAADQAIQVLEIQDILDASSAVMKSTSIYGTSKAQASEMRRNILESNGLTHFYLDKEELQEFAKDDEKGARVRALIDEAGVASAGVNAPIKVPAHKFLDLHDDYPELSEYIRLNPEGMSPNGARKFLKHREEVAAKRSALKEKLRITTEMTPEERAAAITLDMNADDAVFAGALETKEVADAYLGLLAKSETQENAPLEDIAKMRERVTAVRDTLGDDQGVQATLRQALEQPEDVNDIFGEESYLNQPVFTDAIKTVLPDAEIDKIEAAQREARLRVIESIDEAALLEMNKTADVAEENMLEVEKEIQLERSANSPRVDLVERFISTKAQFRQTTRYQTEEDLTAAHHKEGYSVFAMDPKSLTKEQRAKYRKSPMLKKHKAFVRGGIDPETAAILLGVKDGDTLLEILHTTDDWEGTAEARVEQRAEDIRRAAEQSVDLNQTAIAAAYHNMTYNHIQEMKYLKDEKWSAVKKGIKRIALPLPRIEEVRSKAQEAVAQTKFRDLNANQFKVGERKSNRLAITAVLKNDLPRAWQAKEAAALNSELTIATHIAIAETKRAIKFAAKFNTKEVQNTLRMAGPSFVKAADEILDVFNLNPAKKDKSIRGSYAKWVQDQIAAGNGDFSILPKYADVRESIDDMTVEQIRVVHQRLQTILHSAKMENKMQQEFGDPAKELQTREAIVSRLDEISKAHPDYDPKRAIDSQGNTSKISDIVKSLVDLTSLIKNSEHILLNADNGVVGGLYNSTIIAPMKGVGKNKGGEHGKINDMLALREHFKKSVIDTIGQDDWDSMQNTPVTVPEFAGSKKLNYGKMTKSQLFVMLLNLGNDGNIDRLVKGFTEDGFTTDLDTIKSVLERELDVKYAVAAQRIFDTYTSYFPRAKALHEKTAGVTPEFVEAKPFTFKGQVFPGGYYPLMYKSMMDAKAVRKRFRDLIEKASGKEMPDLKDHFYADTMTKHGHMLQRTDNDQPINLSINSIGMGFEMILHDLNFRLPIRDALHILLDPTVSAGLESTVGSSDYRVVVNSIIEASGSVQMENNMLFDMTLGMEKLGAMGRAGYSAAVLIGNLSSILIQPTSMLYAVERMGVSGQKHLLNTLVKMQQNPELLVGFYEFGGEIHPSIKANRSEIDDNTRDIISKLLPDKNINSVTAAVDAMRQFVTDRGYEALGMMDNFMKVIVSVSAYRQFIEGDAPGFDLATVRKMTPEELDHQARVYASSVSRLTLTAGSDLDKAPIQKKAKMISMFFNDPRNILNNTMRQTREIRHSAKAGRYGTAVRGAIVMYTTMALAKAYIDIIRGNPTPWDSDAPEDPEELAKMWVKYLATVPYDVVVGNPPVVRDVKYAIDSMAFKRGRVEVTMPAQKMLSDIGTTIEMAWHFMDFYDGMRQMRPHEQKALGFTVSAATGGIPVNSIYKLYKGLDEMGAIDAVKESFSFKNEALADGFVDRAREFKKDQAKLPAEEQVSPEILKAIEMLEKQLEKQPKDQGSGVSQETYDIIKEIESGGTKEPWRVKNPNSTAAGMYQFLEETWRDLMQEAPHLGLTEEGRTSRNPEQQEAAMRYFTEKNVRILKRAGIETSTENIYAAHFLGAKAAVRVLSNPGTVKLKALVSDDVMSANNFSGGMKVKQFKAWLTEKVSKASEKVASLDKESVALKD